MILSQINWMEVWPIIATVVGIATGICTGALWFSMQGLKDSIASTSARQQADSVRITALAEKMSVCKIDCDRSMVSKEDWVRAEGYTRQLLERVSLQLAEMQGQIQITDKMPEIVGQIVRQVVTEVRRA
jgi:hypothetical protein